MTWLMTLACTRDEAEALAAVEIEGSVLAVSEPDSDQPERWQLDAYFEDKPSRDLLRQIARLVPSAREKEPRAKPLPNADWVSVSQGGFEPLIAGRFHVRTPDHPARADLIDIVIPAGLAFGTGQHATTAGCLEALTMLKRRGRVFRNVLDLGTGTGLLAFAARRLWRSAALTASDIDPVSITVTRENAVLNRVRARTLIAADGLAHRQLVARAPYDLIIANILAQPLIDMAPSIAAALAPRGSLVLAGLLDPQAEQVVRTYRKLGVRPSTRIDGQWPVLTLTGRR